jgi:subtilisin family serine protease
MKQPWWVGVAVAISASLLPYVGEAQPMIVVFHDDAPFEHFRQVFRADERWQASPDAWDYVDHGVAGAVQAFEARLGLRADHLYSAALRGFSARLTAAQISARDCNGHGTHVAGTAAAIDNDRAVVGAAPGARLVGIKVLNCFGSGQTSSIIKGVDFVTANAPKPAVANMSLGSGVSDALDTAVVNSANSGIFYAVAGNDGQDACNASPARVGGTNHGIMTVAATDMNNQEADFSNFGNCVDIWAPGVDILSTRLLTGTIVNSGTSMATPHVAGTAAVETAIKANAVSTGTNSKDGQAISLLSGHNF